MYKCQIEKRVYQNITNKNDYTALYYELELETAPQPGQVLKDGQWYSGTLTTVIWAIDDECFDCRVEDEFPFTQGHETCSHDWIVQTYQQDGWSISAEKIVQTD